MWLLAAGGGWTELPIVGLGEHLSLRLPQTLLSWSLSQSSVSCSAQTKTIEPVSIHSTHPVPSRG